MSVLQIVYRSLAAEGLNEEDVLDILRVSQSSNQNKRISGLLVYRAPVFVQLLEGPEAAVSALFEKIAQDGRHRAIEVIARNEALRPVMPTWAMGYFSPALDSEQVARDDFVFDDQQVRSLCAALPAAIGAPFLAVLES